MIRQPRQQSDKHLAFIRGLPCLVCQDNTSTEAAHLRLSDPRVGKRQVGTSEKPDDKWTLPLCGRHHREQHTTNERLFWRGTDPVLVALALWAASGNHDIGEGIVRYHAASLTPAEQAPVGSRG
jgi:hypothetical protein